MRYLPTWVMAIAFVVPGRCISQQPGPATQSPSPSVVTVHGHGEVRMMPDEAHVRLGVIAQAPTAKEAQADANRAAGAITAAVRAQGVSPRELQTTALTLQPIYASQPHDSDTPPRIVAYRASNVVTVRVTALGRVGDVIDAALGAGANTLDGLTFTLRDDAAARDSALALAVHEASGKARTIAAALHLRLGRVTEVDEQGVQVMPVAPMLQRGMTMAAVASTPVEAGDVTVTADVTVQFEVDSLP